MLKRALLIFTAFLAILIAGGASLMSGSQLSRTVNWLLPQGWTIHTPEGISPHWQGLTLPQLTLSYQQCPIFSADKIDVQWFEQHRLELTNATLDYHCLTQLPETASSDSNSSLAAIIALLPEGQVNIQQLHWINLPTDLPERLTGLLQSPSQISLRFEQQILTAKLNQQQIELEASLQQQQLNTTIDYHPTQEQHQIQLTAHLEDNLSQLPAQLEVKYQWQLPETLIPVPFQQGEATLQWQKQEQQLKGHLQLTLNHNEQNHADLPFSFDGERFAIEQGFVQSDLIPDFPIRAFISTTLTPNRFQLDQLYPIKTSLRISLLSQNDKGKGNIVIYNQAGEINPNSLKFPLQITGNVKQHNYILYSAVPLDIQGKFDDLTLKFLQGALIRITGKERFLAINELRFPLAGIRIDKSGISGRLQAIFKGESPDFKQIEMHLDGFAHHFKVGTQDLFRDPSDTNAIKDRWQWRFWGSSQINALKNKVSLAGRGQWHGDLIQLSEFKGNLDKIQQNGIRIASTELSLTQPINFTYKSRQLTGGVTLNSPEIQFDYGGLLEKPKADLTFNGEIENLNFKGNLTAGKLGPIRIFARRQLTAKSSNLLGKLYWLEQPANIFQSLLPFRNNWLITNGTIKGETAFSVNAEKGLIAGGHFAIRNGAISFPNGDIKGLDFSLPYRFQHNQIELGKKQALTAQAELIDFGVPLTNVRVKIQGYLPYSKRQPLYLRELSLNLLGGSLNVDKFALPQYQQAYLHLNNIRFEQLLALTQYHQIKLTGQANAVLPFWLSGKPCYICDGELTQITPSHLRFTPQFIEAIKQAGYTEQILAYMFNDSQINRLNAKINLDSQGNLQLQAQIRSQLQEHQKAKINLNYHHQENLFELWQLINYGSQFEQNIEHTIYQKLDSR